jgi:membrane fusion protein (multidrug efflux system)
LYRAAEHEEVARLDRELELELLTFLQTPSDPRSRSRIITLRAARVAADARLQERLVRAPQAGTVTSLWVKAGQRVIGGERVASLTPDSGVTYTLLAVLPGSSLSQVKVGQTLRFNPDGLARSYHEHRVIWTATEAVGPAQVARFFGPERGDAFALSALRRWFEQTSRRVTSSWTGSNTPTAKV